MPIQEHFKTSNRQSNALGYCVWRERLEISLDEFRQLNYLWGQLLKPSAHQKGHSLAAVKWVWNQISVFLLRFLLGRGNGHGILLNSRLHLRYKFSRRGATASAKCRVSTFRNDSNWNAWIVDEAIYQNIKLALFIPTKVVAAAANRLGEWEGRVNDAAWSRNTTVVLAGSYVYTAKSHICSTNHPLWPDALTKWRAFRHRVG